MKPVKDFFEIDFAGKMELHKPCSMFLDSGVFSLLNKSQAAQNDEFFDTDEFYLYMDEYSRFVGKYGHMFDVIANVDVIGNPKLTYRNQKYLEKRLKKKTPLPVVHFGTDTKWVQKYMDEGYKYLALGGLAKVAVTLPQDHILKWIDNVFEVICDNKKRIPKIKVHGFGVTSFRIMRRYPWYSVDSTSWTLTAGFGSILVPMQKNGVFDYSRDPLLVKVTTDTKRTKAGASTDYLNLSPSGKRLVHEWLDYIKMPFGGKKNVFYKSNSIKNKYGVSNHYLDRRAANVRYFELFSQSLPNWPWSFRVSHRPSFD